MEILSRTVFKKKEKSPVFEGVWLNKTCRWIAEINRSIFMDIIFPLLLFIISTPYDDPLFLFIYLFRVFFFFLFSQRIISVGCLLASKMHFSIKEMPA